MSLPKPLLLLLPKTREAVGNMCGVFGWQWKRDKVPTRETRVKLATVLALLNDTRGGTSWGFAAPSRDGIDISKGMGHAVAAISEMAGRPVVMGHTRMPTRGAAKVENTHPFEFGKIVGSHNGQVYNWADLEKKYEERAKFEVDSMHLIAHLAEGKPLDEIEGYGTTTYIDRDHLDRVYLCKVSDGGDLAIAATDHGAVWSSSEEHLHRALEAAGLKYQDYKVKAHRQYYLVGGELFYVKGVTLKLKERSYVSYSGGSSYTNGWSGYHHTRSHYEPEEPWELKREKWQKEEEERWRGQGREPDRSKNICQAPKCTGSIDKDGVCVKMASWACTGSKGAYKEDPAASVPKASEQKRKEDETIASALLTEFTWDAEGSENPRRFTELDRDYIRAQTCLECMLDNERTEAGYHRIERNPGAWIYRPCGGPSDFEMRVFGLAVEFADQLPTIRREGQGVGERWATYVGGTCWTFLSAQAAKARSGAAHMTAQTPTSPGTDLAKSDS